MVVYFTKSIPFGLEILLFESFKELLEEERLRAIQGTRTYLLESRYLNESESMARLLCHNCFGGGGSLTEGPHRSKLRALLGTSSYPDGILGSDEFICCTGCILWLSILLSSGLLLSND